MKSKIILVFIVCVLLGTGGYLLLNQRTGIPLSQNEQPPLMQDTDTNPTDPVQYLIQSLDKKPKGLWITPHTTTELQAYFAEATPDAVPRVFAQQLPTDFAEKGDKKLFAQVISALILQENERILTERAILILLKAIQEKGEKWTDLETDYFNTLVQKYDSVAKREPSAEMADLLNKVSAIPPIVAVAQSAVATDWGRTNLESPFGQTGWIDTQNYTTLKFNSLSQALSSYATEMNGLPSLQDWRFLRETLRSQRHTDTGYRVLRVLGDYNPEDPHYAQKLQDSVNTLENKVPDSLTFLPWIEFGKGEISIQSQNKKIPFQVEIANSDEQEKRGLMFRGYLSENSGMLFLSDTEHPQAMWMKNTYIPLDIIFFDKAGKIQTIIENAKPLSLDSRPSLVPVLGAIELPAGTVQKHGISVGDMVIYK